MQLIEQRKSGLWKWLLAPVILIAGVFLLVGWAMYMMIMAAVQEEPQTESATDYAGTDGMVYTISPIGEKQIPKQFLPIYEAAGKKYSVPWSLLAAEHKVETNFSSIKNMISPVGATGHLQFMPCTWIKSICPFI